MTERERAKKAVRPFQVPGDLLDVLPFGNGHINDTYCAVFSHQGTARRFLLQRINTDVFTRPAELMQNIQRITEHIARQEDASPALTLIHTHAGQTLHTDEQGGCWRMFQFIEGARTLDHVDTPDQAYEIAAAFGRFLLQVADLGSPRLHETIPGFHDTPKRFKVLEEAVRNDVAGRAQSVAAEIEFALTHKALASQLIHASLPERITHNDTKFNNVLLDEYTGKAQCVIDLDTVMPGLAPHDFGDMVRSMTSPAAEDEPDLSKVEVRMPVFEALVRGYLSAAGGLLNQEEKKCLPLGGKIITFENGLRFLADYLNGDVYYKVHRPLQNLDRCRTQFKLLQSIERHEEQMNRIVASAEEGR